MIMRHFDELHPMVLGIYFAAVIFPVMFMVNIYTAAALLITGILYKAYLTGRFPARQIGASFLITAVMTLCSCIFSHDGTTELFFINGRAVTLEALCYGAVTGVMLSAVIVWFDSFSRVMTSEKIMVLFRKMPSVALVISMILRLVPQYVRRYGEVRQAQKANHGETGESREGILKISSAVFTWALENSMQTADSIIRRGGMRCAAVRKRKFKGRDMAVLLIILCLQFTYAGSDMFRAAGTLALGFIPLILEGKEHAKWHFYGLRR